MPETTQDRTEGLSAAPAETGKEAGPGEAREAVAADHASLADFPGAQAELVEHLAPSVGEFQQAAYGDVAFGMDPDGGEKTAFGMDPDGGEKVAFGMDPDGGEAVAA